MKTKKQIVTVFATACLAGMLAGCSTKSPDMPGAAELLTNVPDLSNTDLSVDIGYTISYPAASGETEETVSGNNEGAENMESPFSTSYGIHYDIRSTEGLAYAKGMETYTYESPDTEPAMDMIETEIWTDKSENPAVSYIFDGESAWYKETNSENGLESTIESTLALLKEGNFGQTSMEKTDDGNYMLTLETMPQNVPLLNLVVNGLLPEDGEKTAAVTAIFDKGTKALQSVSFHTDAEIDLGYEDEPLPSGFACTITILINSTGDITLKMPEGMAENAIDLAGLYGDMDPALPEQDTDAVTTEPEAEVSGNDIPKEETKAAE